MSCSTVAGSSDHPVAPSSSSGSDKVPAIFLSHSGAQKPFVENLFEALRRVNHNAFFDQETLPKGALFPERIKTAACKCELGVVVLSDDYLTSKWPMLELEILVNQRGPEPRVLPLFFKLRPDDLRSEMNLSNWKGKWHEMNVSDEEADNWEKALRILRRLNGEIFVQGTREALYIERVVQSICKQLPSPLVHDMPYIVGHDRLAKEIAGHFDCVWSARQDNGACMVGLHGIGGAGKTTICKNAANFYSSIYVGRSHHLELPTTNDKEAKKTIVQTIKVALKALANLDDDLLGRANDIDQVIQLMRTHVSKFDVFLAIDNVWLHSREAVTRILKVGYSTDSKILVTSRSEEVLKDMLRDCKNSYLGPLPNPEHEEAFQIFREAVELVDLKSSLTGKELLHRALERCKFSGTYHPLALRALGLHVRNACGRGDPRHFEENLSSVLEGISNVGLSGLEDVIRLSYDNLQETKKHIFLDIAVWVIYFFGPISYEKVQKWLISVYSDNSLSKSKIIETMNELFQDGLLQLDTFKSTGLRRITVHDLFLDLADKVTATSSRFFIEGKRSSNVERIQWKELERVWLRASVKNAECVRFIQLLQQKECPTLQALYAVGVNFSRGIDLCLMPSLRVLTLCETRVKGIQNWSASALVSIDIWDHPSRRGDNHPVMKHLNRSSMRVLKLKNMAQLQRLRLGCVDVLERIEGLDTLKNLQELEVYHCQSLKDLGELSGLLRLKSIEVSGCSSIRRLPDLSRLTCLEQLLLSGNKVMEQVGSLSPTLKSIQIFGGCLALNALDLTGLTCLERLELSDISLLEELQGVGPSLRIVSVNGCWAFRLPSLSAATRLTQLSLEKNRGTKVVGSLSPSVEDLSLRSCTAMKRVADVSGLTGLKSLVLQENSAMEELGSLGVTLEKLTISGCGALRKLPTLDGLTRLEELDLSRDGLEDKEVRLSASLRSLSIRCEAWKKLPDIGGLTRLKELVLGCDGSMDEVSGHFSPSLERLEFTSCRAMKKSPDLSALTRLEELKLEGNEAMEELGGVSSTLKRLEIAKCHALKKLPNLSGLTHLVRLELDGNESLQEVGGLSSSLQNVAICGCPALKKVPGSSGLTGLQTLELTNNEAMEEVGHLSSSLSFVHISRCGALKKAPDMSGLTRLERLVLRENVAMEEVAFLCSSLRDVELESCSALRKVPDMSGLSHLERLVLRDNVAMEEVGHLSSSLEFVSITGCHGLKKVPTISGLSCLESLILHDNEALEEVEGESVSDNLTYYLSIENCRQLRRFPKQFEGLCSFDHI